MWLLTRPTGLLLLNEVPYITVVMKSRSSQTYGFKGIATLPAPTAGIVRQGGHLNVTLLNFFDGPPPLKYGNFTALLLWPSHHQRRSVEVPKHPNH